MTEANTNQKSGRLRRLVLIVIVVALGWYIFDGSVVKTHVPVDFEKQYAVAKRSTPTMARCVLAGLVAETYRRNETKYKAWRKIEEADCDEAGL